MHVAATGPARWLGLAGASSERMRRGGQLDHRWRRVYATITGGLTESLDLGRKGHDNRSVAVLLDRLGEDLKEAMRSGDTVRRDEIRGLIAALKAERQSKLTRELEKRGLIVKSSSHGEEADLTPEQAAEAEGLRNTTDLTPDEEQAVLQQRVKQHRQSIESFAAGRREDLKATEEAQLAALSSYLPQQLGESEIEQAIRAAIGETNAQGPRDQGKVMGLLSGRLRGRADMRAVSARGQKLLAGG